MIAIRHPLSLDIRPHRATLAGISCVCVCHSVSHQPSYLDEKGKMVSCGTHVQCGALTEWKLTSVGPPAPPHG